jgi:exopolysaccharide biosynthesis polyprenyl glycosylphosphotransferase
VGPPPAAELRAQAPAALAAPTPSPRRILRSSVAVGLRTGLDGLLLLCSAALARISESRADPVGSELTVLFPAVVLGALIGLGHYRRRIGVSVLDGLAKILVATSIASIGLIAAAGLLKPYGGPAALIGRTWLIALIALAVGHVVTVLVVRRLRATRVLAKRTIIVGAGVIGAEMERRMDEHPELGLEPVGYVDSAPPRDVEARQAPLLGNPEDLPRVVRETGAEHVVMAFPHCPDRKLVPLLGQCESLGVDVSLVPRLFERTTPRVVDDIGGIQVHDLRFVNPNGWQFRVKHLIDRIGALVLLVVFTPALLAIAAAVRLSSPGPVLFRQTRVGRDGRDFQMLKFRSMRLPPAEEDRQRVVLPTGAGPGGVEGTDRRTPVGTFLRRTSLDELPQLINVLRGEMSFVGPRPERPEFVGPFTRHVRRYGDRHRVKSGLTGWAQVNGLRGQTSLSDRIEADNQYIENWSLRLDLRILLMTIAVLCRRSE